MKCVAWASMLLAALLGIWRGSTGVSAISDLTYIPNRNTPHSVYLEEDGMLVSFLVLENGEDGTTLLVREHALDEPRIYNRDTGAYPAYYAGSSVDQYLNGDYLDSLAPGTDLRDIGGDYSHERAKGHAC